MNLQKKELRTRKIVLFILATTVALTLYVVGAYIFKLPPFGAQAPSSPIGDAIKQEYAPVPEGKASGEPGGQATQGLPDNSSSTTSDDVPSSSDTINITSFSQENGQVRASATVSHNEGTCVFLYTTEGDKPVTQQVAVENSTCRSAVGEVSFSKLGTWNLKVTYYRNAQKAEAVRDVEIR